MEQYNSNNIARSAFACGKSLMIALLCLLMALPLSAQNRTVRGVVYDTTGETVIGANVTVVGTSRGTITDIDGKFQIEASAKDKLKITFIGYADAIVSAAKTDLKVTLEEDNTTLEEVVVVGYGTQKKATLTGAVSAVTSKEIAVTKNENVVNMLSGKIPGVRITQRSAQPGEYDNAIDIRGMGEPLIVVDGIPRDKGYFSRMDANEIESVSVLKDASAAIYGVRAANGVILVTSKRGDNTGGKFDITFSANYGWQNFLYIPETATATDHMLLMNEKTWNRFNENYAVRSDPAYRWDQILGYSSTGNRGTNWTDELFDSNVPQEQYNVSMNGGSEKIQYFFNIGYMKQNGSYKSGSLNYKRWNFRSNIDAQITKRLKASVQLSGYIDEKNQPFTDIWAVYKKAWTYKPTAIAYVNGDHSLPAYTTEFLESDNPVAVINSDLTGYRREKGNNFNGSLALTYDIPGVKGLSAKAFYSYDYAASNNTEYKRAYNLYSANADGTLASYARNSDSYLKRTTNPSYNTMMQLSLNYANKFGDHNVGAFVLFEEQYSNWDSFYAQRVMNLSGEYLIYGEDEEQVGSMYGAGDKTRQSILGRLNYDWKGRYMVDFTFRYDGSSSYPSNGRWGFFPGVSAGWRISEEDFMKELVPFMTNLKLRASYGEMGDDGTATTYPETAVAYEINKDKIGYYYNGAYVTGVAATAVPNPDKTWYTSKTYNLGLDFDLWNGKLSGTFELFKRKRVGLLERAQATVPDIVGATLPQENIEKDQTFGWEVSLGHRNRVLDIDYWVNAQVSATKNRWDFHLDSPAGNSMANWYRTNVSGRNKDIWFAYEEGGRFSNWEQIRYHGTTGSNYGQGTLPGDYWYEDWNGDGIVNDNDRHPVASFNLPVFNYGITLGAAWRGVDLSMNWQGSAGVYNSYDEVFTEVGPFNGGAALDIYKDRWHTVSITDDPWNPNTEWVSGLYPATGHSFNTGSTGIKNSSYLRLKTLELGYTLPKQWVSKAGIKNLRVYVNAYNLLTITGLDNIDPERPGAQGSANSGNADSSLFYRYPVNRTFNIGATLKF
ncbi:MAG: TonB-dependent receptor [Bacteroides sp.]|nr:TonB-dependent receptor [Bacteroides sp.]